MVEDTQHYSNRQVDRAGKFLAAVHVDPTLGEREPEKLAECERIAEWYSELHVASMMNVHHKLKRITAQLPRIDNQVLVSYRSKRMISVTQKLVRQPTMKLSSIGDLGGCRIAPLPSLTVQDQVVAEIFKLWPDARLRDYVAQPRDSGYRAKHLAVREDGRRIEIQVRTTIQHRWADTVESSGDQLGYDFKGGEGPAELLELLKLASQWLAKDEMEDLVS